MKLGTPAAPATHRILSGKNNGLEILDLTAKGTLYYKDSDLN